MKKVLFFLLSMWIVFACSEDKEIPTVDPPVVNPDSNEKPNPVEGDSIYYQLNVDGFELVAATEDSTCLFLQTDTTFAFSCLFDSCGANRLVAYCDSTGLVERIVADGQVVNVLHHENKKKMDIFYKDAEGKMAWIKDVESPYKDLSSRAEGDVPYSAVSIVNDLSYAVYTIINTYDVVKHKPWENFIDKYSRKEFYNMRSTVALKLIVQILGEEYKVSVSNHISTIVTVMSDYSKWVIEELYGDAIPHLRKYAVRKSVNGLILTAYVTDVDSLHNEFKIGVLVAEKGDRLNGLNYLDNQGSDYNSQKINYSYSFISNPELLKKGIKLVTGKDYKFIPYLAPASTSKYAKGIKSLLDCYKYGTSQTHLLLEAKAEEKSTENDVAKLELKVENARRKMGIIYSEYEELLKHDYKKIEFEPTTEEKVMPGDFEKEVKLSYLKPGKVHYMPYVIYDDNIINRQIYGADTVISTAITEKDYTFYGKQGVLDIILNPKTQEATINGRIFKGYFIDPNGKWATEKSRSSIEVSERGFVIQEEVESKSSRAGNYPDITVENAKAVKATSHKDSIFEVSTELAENVSTVYYRAYIKVNDKYYYGEVKKCTKDSLRDALIKLYQSTNGDNWKRNDNWCSDKPVTEWYGVDYDRYDERYTIHLQKNNLTGKIEQAFPEDLNIYLICYINQLTSLDVSGVMYLQCHQNQLTSLDVSGCTALKYLYCHGNQLTSLDVSGCTALESLNCSSNQLTSLDVSSCTALENLDCGHNPLTSLDVSGLMSLNCSSNQLTSLDVSSCTALESLSCAGNQLTSLDVSSCTALESLNCSSNQLTSLDVSSCTALESLSCAGNPLTSLDVSSCTALENLSCGWTQLTSLDVSGFTALENLSCGHSQLTSLNASGCTALKYLFCVNNQLTSLDVSGCTSLDYLHCKGNKIRSVIPGWFSQIKEFYHDARYFYYQKKMYKDNGYGWWYPGEPEKGYHRP